MGFDTFGPSVHLYNALIEDLLKNGHIVHIIEMHSSGMDADAPCNLEKHSGFSYETIKSKQVNKHAFVRRYLTGLAYCIKAIPALISNTGYDILFVQSCPWAPIAISFARIFNRAYVIWNIQDMFPGASIANGVVKNKILAWCMFVFHKIAYRFAQHITVISEDMKQKVFEQGVNEEKITMIPDWFDSESVKEIKRQDNLFIKKYNMDEKKFYVQYAGTMGYNFDYKYVIEVASILKDNKDIVFQMIGNGSQKDSFVKEAQKRNLDNIVFLPLEPQSMVSHVYSACSICIIPLPFGVIGNSVPSKAGLLMRCRRPIVTSADLDSHYCETLKENRLGIPCSCFNPQKMAEAIILLKNSPSLREELSNNAQKYALMYYDRKANTKKYESLFQSKLNVTRKK